MAEKKGLTDLEIKVIVENEIRQAMGNQAGDLSAERATNMERYLGEPNGNEMEGRSAVQSRDVLDVIEWILPSLIRIFSSTDRAVELDPVGPEDEQQAKQETDFLNYLFYKKNKGFLILYTWFKDALLSKNGIVKVYAEEEKEVKREEYSDISDVEYYALLADSNLELIEHTEEVHVSDQGQPYNVHDCVFLCKKEYTEIKVDNIPPEEHIISTDATSVDCKKARFNGHYTTKTVSELREMGFTESQIDQMEDGISKVEMEVERYERNNLSDETRYDNAPEANSAMRTKKITEGYLYADRNGDGIAEILKVLVSGDFIDIEDVDRVPFNAITPIILTHKFYGLAVADILRDLQDMRTALLRSYFDNFYQTINGTTYYDENTVNVEDMLTSTPYGIRGVDGMPANSILHIPPSGLPPEAFSLMELMKDLRADRIGDFVSQLDPNVIANANNGVVVEMLNEAKAKVEMIARVFAETGVRDLFRDLHELSRKHGHKETVVKLRNDWYEVDPRQWKERTDFTIRVGLGIRNKQEEMVSLKAILEEQYKAIELGVISPIMMNQKTGEQYYPIWESQKRYAEIMGEEFPDKYFPNPSFMPPPPPPPPDPQEQIMQLTAQIESQKDQTKRLELQLRAQKDQADVQLEDKKIQANMAIQQGRNEANDFKNQLNALKHHSDNMHKEWALKLQEYGMLDESELERRRLMLEQVSTDWENSLRQYEADLDAAVKLAQSQQLQVDNSKDMKIDSANKIISQLMDQIEEMKSQIQKPKKIIRDSEGRIVQVGNQRVLRDESGFVTGIE